MTTYPPIVGLTLNYRDANRTLRCVHSLLDEGVMHVLVWDNSEDGGASAAVLAECLKVQPKVSIERSPANLGFSAGVNRGLEWLANRFSDVWVLLINNDARLLPGGLDVLRRSLSANSDAKLIYPDINHGGCVIGTMYYQRWLGLLSKRPLSGSFLYPSGCCLLIAPELALSPLLDEDFFMYGEDWLLGWFLGRQNGSLVHVPQTLVMHDGSAGSGLGTPFYEERMVAAHLIMAQKLAQNRFDLSALLLGRISMLIIRSAVRTLRYRSFVPMRALFRGWHLARGHDPLLAGARASSRAPG